MRMPLKQFQALRRAIHAAGGLLPNATARERWDMLWHVHDAKAFDVGDLYPGLTDEHIDTALRRIAQGRFYI